MAEVQNMGEARVKKIVELMLKSDAPMCCMLFFPDLIRKPKSVIQGYDIITREVLCVRDIYSQINSAELDELTGKTIIEANKPLVAEFFSISVPIWEQLKKSEFKPQNVPKRLDDICGIIFGSTKKHYYLPGKRIYESAYNLKYLERDHSRYDGGKSSWFIAGKPVIYHPEKLPQLVEFAQRLKTREFRG